MFNFKIEYWLICQRISTVLVLKSKVGYALSKIDDSAKGGLTQFWEHFAMIPCAPKYLER